jgi:hexosaminidase
MRLPGSITCTIVLLASLSFQVTGTSLEDFNRQFRLIPQPQHTELLDGPGFKISDLQAVFLKNLAKRPVMEPILDRLPLCSGPAFGVVSLILSKDIEIKSVEGYILEIKNKQITIEAREAAGLFYGLQTLAQLLEDSRDQQIEIPACRITDFPSIDYRAIHLDLKHHLDATKYYYDLVDRLSRIKINAIIIEFEDKLRFRKSPLVGSPNSIPIEEFAALSRYARERFIEISPLVQGLGHASFILKHEEYKSLRDDPFSDWVFDPLNPGTYDLQFSLYEDAIEATPYGKYLHVGGDEVGTLGKSELCRKSGMSPFELQMYWLKKVTAFATAHNRIPIFWDDMAFKLSGLYQTTYDPAMKEETVQKLWEQNQSLLDKSLPLFPAECIFMRWNYDCPQISGNQKAIDWYKSNNLKVMAATAAACMEPVLPRSKNHFQAIRDFCKLTAEKKMNGILCTIWDDCSNHLETVMRGIYDYAFFSWNYIDVPVETVHAAYRQRFYGVRMEPGQFEFQDQLEQAVIFWEKALLQSGDRENYHTNFQLINLPDDARPGEWSRLNDEKIMNARTGVETHATIASILNEEIALSNRNRYNLEVFNQINELLVYPSRLILQLEAYDKASPKDKAIAALQLRELVESFDTLRTNFENVYAQTRIMGNPEGYQLDSNFHEHLANGTNNTDWMYMYELPMNRNVLDMLVKYKAK